MGSELRRQRLEGLYAAHASAVYAYARRRTDEATAEDVVSEVFVVVWRRIEQVPADALPWLVACARRVLANQHRATRRRQALLDQLEADVTRATPPDLPDSALARAFATLSAADQEVLALVAWEELTGARAASAFECSPQTFSMRLHRARRRLSAALTAAEASAVSTGGV